MAGALRCGPADAAPPPQDSDSLPLRLVAVMM